MNDTHSELWFATDPYTSPQIFDENLGPLEPNTFVLSHEYMFVQVSECRGRYKHMYVGGAGQMP